MDIMQFLTTEGRLNRAKYLLYSFGLAFAVIIVATVLSSVLDLVGMMLSIVLYFAAIIPSVFFAIRRLHDLDRPGSHAWYLLIPFYNIYMSIILLFKKGTDGPNTYGEDPLAQPQLSPTI